MMKTEGRSLSGTLSVAKNSQRKKMIRMGTIHVRQRP